HPSFIEPYQGAATGVGGILRDIFTMGARPIASLNSLRFGSLSAPRMRHLVDGVVRGIAGYGNCMGVPTVGGETTFHAGYNGNILVNVMNVGIVRQDRIFRGRAEGPGNPVVYVGSKTGRDGIHGATMASEEFAGDETRQKKPAIQVGDPFTEKLLLEACLELFETDAVEIGRVTSSGRVVLFFEGEIVADLPAEPLSSEAPVYDRPRSPTAQIPAPRWPAEPEPSDYGECLRLILASPNVSEKSWIWT